MKPNIVLITCHDLGTHLGCYDQKTVPSPNLDSFASTGVRFTRAFCTAPLCSPSRAALHTGRYPHSTGVLGLTHPPFSWQINEGERHLAAILRDAGYAEAVLVGFQHISMDPASLGYTRCSFKLAPAREVAAEAVEFLRSHPPEPFHLEVGFFETHRPFDWGGAAPDSSNGVVIPHGLPESEELRGDCAALQGAVAALDSAVGKVLDALRAAGLEENTWVVFTTDHGLPLVRAKGTLYDAGLETALIMRWPAGGLAGGRTCDDLWSNVDLVPTLLEGCGIERPDELHGRSFWPRLSGPAAAPRSCVYAEKTYHTGYEPIRAVRTATHKLIVNFESGPAIDVPTDIALAPGYAGLLGQVCGLRRPVELYDLAADPEERADLAGDPAHAGVRRELLRLLHDWMQETRDPLLEGPVASPFRARALEAFNDA